MITSTANGHENATNYTRFDWRWIGKVVQENELILGHGICLPAVCSSEKVIDYAKKILSQAGLEAVNAVCRTNDAISFQAIDILAFVVLSLLTTLLLASTIYDVTMIRKNQSANKLLTAFSVYTHGAKLFKLTENKSPNVIECLNGIKTLSIFWIVFGHRFDERDYVPLINAADSSDFTSKFIYLVYTNHLIAVESFFLIGGLLITWSLLNAFEKKSANIPRLYLHRYLRYTPTLAVVVLFYTSFTKFLASGPFFNPSTANCEKYWWTTLLHVSVYTNPLEICFDISWYLAVDFQLFIASPLLIYPLWRWGKKFFWVLPTVVLLVAGCIFTTTYINEITVYVGAMKNLEGIFLWIEKFYFPTHLRIGSWVIGMMLGYVMYPNRDSKIYINKTVERVSWILSISVMLCITLGHYPFQQIENNTTTRFSNSFYNSFARIGWSFAVSWIIYACHNGSGGIVRWFLSLKQWQPLGKMGLSIYLVHRMYQIITTMNQKQPIYWDFFTQTQKFFGDIFVSVCLGAVLYLAVENPVMLIESYLHKKINK